MIKKRKRGRKGLFGLVGVGFFKLEVRILGGVDIISIDSSGEEDSFYRFIIV